VVFLHARLYLISNFWGLFLLLQAFPDALFHQLLLTMAHLDRETQIGAHSVFSVVLVPSMVSPWLDQKKIAKKVESHSLSIQRGSFSRAEHLNGKLVEEKVIAGVSGNKIHSCSN
jgi:hypothetical protein